MRSPDASPASMKTESGSAGIADDTDQGDAEFEGQGLDRRPVDQDGAPPASTAMASIPAAAAPRMVCGPTAGRSLRQRLLRLQGFGEDHRRQGPASGALSQGSATRASGIASDCTSPISQWPRPVRRQPRRPGRCPAVRGRGRYPLRKPAAAPAPGRVGGPAITSHGRRVLPARLPRHPQPWHPIIASTRSATFSNAASPVGPRARAKRLKLRRSLSEGVKAADHGHMGGAKRGDAPDQPWQIGGAKRSA